MGSETLPLIEVERLQLGMFVVLDVGWRNHPFAFSSFAIRNAEQLAQLRSFGPRQVRYCPQRSSVGPLPAAAPMPAATAAPAASEAPTPASATAAAPAESPATREDAALRKVEAAYRQAAQRHQLMLKQLLFEPIKARQIAEELGETLYQLVADGREMAVRLLSDRIGERPSGHEIGTAALAMLLARDCELPAEQQRELALAAVLHDIGKIKIPTFLHEDHGKLSDFERQTYRRHVELGLDLVRSLGLSGAVLRAIGEHHEHADGSGFPSGRAGEQLSPTGRVLAIVNRYHNLVCPQRSENGLTPHLALKQMYGPERSHFDPVYLPRFVRVMGVYPPGSLVELSDQRTAIVVASRPGMSLAPRVQLVTSPEQEAAEYIDLDPLKGLGVRGCARPDQLDERWAQRARQLARLPIFLEPFAPTTAQRAA